VFPEQEGKVLPADQPKGGGKEFPDRGKRLSGPAGSRGEFLGPGVGGGEQEETAGTNQIGQDFEEKLFGIFDPIDEVGGENEVESSQPRQAQGVAGSKTDTIPDFAGRGHCPDGLSQATFLFQPK